MSVQPRRWAIYWLRQTPSAPALAARARVFPRSQGVARRGEGEDVSFASRLLVCAVENGKLSPLSPCEEPQRARAAPVPRFGGGREGRAAASVAASSAGKERGAEGAPQLTAEQRRCVQGEKAGVRCFYLLSWVIKSRLKHR